MGNVSGVSSTVASTKMQPFLPSPSWWLRWMSLWEAMWQRNSSLD